MDTGEAVATVFALCMMILGSGVGLMMGRRCARRQEAQEAEARSSQERLEQRVRGFLDTPEWQTLEHEVLSPEFLARTIEQDGGLGHDPSCTACRGHRPDSDACPHVYTLDSYECRWCGEDRDVSQLRDDSEPRVHPDWSSLNRYLGEDL